MTFNIEHFKTLIVRLDDANERQRTQLQHAVQLGRLALDEAWYLAPAARASGHHVLTDIGRVSLHLINIVGSALVDSRVVFAFWESARGWTEVRARASAVAGNLDPANRLVGAVWHGSAATAYAWVTPSQRNAVLRVDAVAHQIQSSLTWAAEAGAVFYLGLLVPVLEIVSVVAAAVPALLSGIGTLPAALALLAVVARVLAQIAELLVLAATVYAWAKVHTSNIRSEGFDQSTYPNGRWPDPHTSLYSDASVTDGDPSGWSPVA